VRFDGVVCNARVRRLSIGQWALRPVQRDVNPDSVAEGSFLQYGPVRRP